MRILALVLGSLIFQSAHAATFIVNSPADAVDANVGNGICASATGACTIRAAIQESNAAAGADTISIPAGTYSLSKTGEGEDLAATGDLDIAGSLTITGASSAQVIIDGLAVDRIFHAGGATTLTISGLTLKSGSPPSDVGGAIYHSGPGTLTLSDVTFRLNNAVSGGAVFHSGTTVIQDSKFLYNNSSSGGSAIFITSAGNLDISGSTFTSNETAATGGAIFQDSGGTLAVSNSTFSSNNAGIGGALYLPLGGNVTISDSSFDSNQGLFAGGGVLYHTGPGNITAVNSTFRGSHTVGTGGAFMISSAGSLNISGSEFVDNAATTGGAILFATSNGSLSITDTTISNNTSLSGGGGGIYASITGALTLENVLLSNNYGIGLSGGIFSSGHSSATISNSTFHNNTAVGATGGAFMDASTGNTTITQSTFSQNAAFDGIGGAIYRSGGGALSISNSAFYENQVTGVGTLGGAIFNFSALASTITNTTFSGNYAGHSGGAFYISSETSFKNCTFAQNSAGAITGGGGLFNAGATATLTNSIFAASLNGRNCGGTAFTSGDNNIDDDGSCALTGPHDRNNIDAGLDSLKDNGGGTYTHSPLYGSPAIDAFSGATCPAEDQRGMARPFDGNSDGSALCDIGAVEYNDLCPDDPAKVAPGTCGCGTADSDSDGNSVIDCLLNAEYRFRIDAASSALSALRLPRSGIPNADFRTKKTAFLGALTIMKNYFTANSTGITANPAGTNLGRLNSNAVRAGRLAAKGKKRTFAADKRAAQRALRTLKNRVAV